MGPLSSGLRQPHLARFDLSLPRGILSAHLVLPPWRQRGAPGRSAQVLPAGDRHHRRGVRSQRHHAPRGPVPPEERFWHGGVLQTIGLSIIVLGPLVPVLRRQWARWMLLALAVLVYLSFGWSRPALARWCAAHPIIGLAIFGDFPPWPWLSAALIGLVLGWWWLEARARGPEAEKRYFATAAVIGLVFLLAYDAWEFWIPTSPRFGFPRDWGLNHYWTPRGVTTFLIVAGDAWLLALFYWLMEVRRWEMPWLVTLGQTALVLYFVHQLLEEPLIHG